MVDHLRSEPRMAVTDHVASVYRSSRPTVPAGSATQLQSYLAQNRSGCLLRDHYSFLFRVHCQTSYHCSGCPQGHPFPVTLRDPSISFSLTTVHHIALSLVPYPTRISGDQEYYQYEGPVSCIRSFYDTQFRFRSMIEDATFI
jgi:hypothetical protein